MWQQSATVLALIVVGLAACAPDETGPSSSGRSGDAIPDAPTTRTVSAPEGATAATAVPVDGNRWLPGTVDLDADPVTVDVGGDLRSLVAAPTATGGTLWVVTTSSGEVIGFTVEDGVVSRVDGLADLRVTPEAPPMLVSVGGAWQVLRIPEEASTTTPALPFGDRRVAYVTREGALRLGSIGDGTVDALDDESPIQDLLRDTRLTLTDDETIVALAGPTDVYGHGVLGDGIEARRVLTVAPGTGSGSAGATILDEVTVADVADGLVVEGTSVILADVDDDGGRDRLITVSGPDEGAQVVALGADAAPITGEPIGQGGRWRHVIGVLPGLDGPEVVEVVTPHLGRRLQFLRATATGRLEVLAAAESLSASHTIGSRDLDQAVLVDVAGLGPSYVGPSVDRTSLLAAHRVGDRVEVGRTVALGAPWATNITGVAGDDGATALGVGLADGRVLVWEARA